MSGPRYSDRRLATLAEVADLLVAALASVEEQSNAAPKAEAPPAKDHAQSRKKRRSKEPK